MLVPAPAAAQELGAGGIPAGVEGTGCGPQEFATGVGGTGCGPQEFAGADEAADAPNAFPVVAPILGFWKLAHGSIAGGALSGDPTLKAGPLKVEGPVAADGPSCGWLDIFLRSSSNLEIRVAASAR